MVEVAFVTPVFVLMIFGIFEFSGYVAAKTGSNAAIRAGTRMATVQGSDKLADQAILERMALEGAGLGQTQDEILEIKIWRATQTGDDPEDNVPPDSSCFEIGDSSLPSGSYDCNLYRNPNQSGASSAFARARLDIFDPEEDTGPVDGTFADYWFGCDPEAGAGYMNHKYDCGWPPSKRRDLTGPQGCTPTNPPSRPCKSTDVVGVYMKVKHKFYTGFFGRSTVLEFKSVSPIEPKGYDRS